MLRRKKNASFAYESLETRQVLAANPLVSFTDGVVTVQGTEFNDTARIDEVDGLIKVAVKSDGQTFDVFEYSPSDVSSIYFAGGEGDDIFVNNTHISVEAFGNDGNDWLLGGKGDDVLKGGSGDDNLRGHAGDDSLHGDYGNDKLFGFSGNDRLLGWYGDDLLIGGAGDDYVSGYLGADILFGNAGNDVIKGHEGDDFLSGGGGADELYGWKGNDRLYGGGGDDYVSGYHGDDILLGQRGNDIVKGHEGADRIFGGDGHDELYGWLGDDMMNGGSGNDELWGGDDDDLLVGAQGNDILHGDMGNDRVYGNAGDDVVVGFYGNDRLIGGSGADMLCGGYDDDAYVNIDDSDVGYDPDGDFVSSPGASEDRQLRRETWTQFKDAMAELREMKATVSQEVQNVIKVDEVELARDQSSSKIYVNDSGGRLASYNTSTGEFQLIGKMDVRMTDIAMSTDGNLYGISFQSLYRIDVENADVSKVGNLGRGDMNALTFTADGQLLAAGFAGNHVYSVNLETAQMTSIGTFNGRSAGDLSFHENQLFVTTSSGQLYSLNLNANGVVDAARMVNNISRVTYGLASQGENQLYSAVGTQLFHVDDSSGTFTTVTNLASNGISQIWGMTEGIS